MAIKISSTTVIDNSRNLTNISNLDSSGISTIGTVQIGSGIVTATSGVVTYYGDGSRLTNIISGVGIQSGTTVVGTGFTDLRFVGASATAIGVSTAVITVNKTLEIGTRLGAQTINVSSGITTIQLRSGVGTIYL